MFDTANFVRFKIILPEKRAQQDTEPSQQYRDQKIADI